MIFKCILGDEVYCFYVDHKVMKVPEGDIVLSDFSSWTLSEWSNSKGLAHKVKVFYEGNVFWSVRLTGIRFL